MRIKIYRAPTLASAMAMVRAEMGADAFILATRSTSQGVELTASVEPREEPLAAPDLPPLFARPAAGLTPATAGAQLAWHGVPPAIAARLAAGNLADSLRAELRFGALRLGAGEKPLLLAGLPGAGKTLTVARLATRLVLAGATPLVITADGRRAGAAEELAAYTRLLGINLMVASHPATLARALQQRGAAAPVLIDTSGANPFDAAELDAVAALAATAGAEAVLVAPAGQDPAEAADQAEAFAAVGITLLLPTRLDLARRLGGIVTAAMAGQLSLTEAGTGPSASDGLARLTPEFLAARLSRTPPLPGPNRQPAQAPHAPTRQR